MGNDPVRLFASVFGAVYIAVGLVGFAVTGVDGFAATEGSELIVFGLNGLHNLVHVAVGGLLLLGTSSNAGQNRAVVGLVSAVYAVVGVAGFFLVGTGANILALNHPDNVLHLITAVAGAGALAAGRRPAEAR